MAVLTLSGKPVDWTDPPKSTDRVRWSYTCDNGQPVTGSFFVICWLDWVNGLAVKKWGTRVRVIQPAYNKGVEASAGTHDFDYCMDLWIPGVAGYEQQTFFRNHCGCFWYRQPWQGFSSHQHGFPMPPGGNVFPTEVGVYVDGGRSQGKSGYSSQLADFKAKAYGLKNLHYQEADPSFDKYPTTTVPFDLKAYIKEQEDEMAAGYKSWTDEDKKAFWDDFENFVKVRPVVTLTKGTDTTKDDKDISLASGVQRLVNHG